MELGESFAPLNYWYGPGRRVVSCSDSSGDRLLLCMGRLGDSPVMGQGFWARGYGPGDSPVMGQGFWARRLFCYGRCHVEGTGMDGCCAHTSSGRGVGLDSYFPASVTDDPFITEQFPTLYPDVSTRSQSACSKCSTCSLKLQCWFIMRRRPPSSRKTRLLRLLCLPGRWQLQPATHQMQS